MRSKRKIILIAAILLVGGFIFWYLRDKIRDAITLREVKTIEKIKEQPVNHYIDVNGRDHATKEEAQVSSDAARIAMRKEFEATAKLLKVKPNKITGITGVGFVDTGKIVAHFDSVRGKYWKPIIKLANGKTDTVQRSFEYVDDYVWMRGFVGKKTVEINYEIDDSLTIASYSKRKWFLGKKRTYVDAHLMNPKAYVRGLTGIRINDKMPGRINIGPYIGVGYSSDDLTHMKVNFGLSVQFALIRF